MAGFDPEVLKRGLNDPAVLLPLVGAVLPNVTHGTSTYKPGQVIGTLGSVYGTVRDEAERQKVMDRATAQMAAAVLPPTPQPMFQNIPVDPMEVESRPQDLAHAIRSFRPVHALGQFYQGLTPEQRRVFLQAPPSSLFGRGTPPAISMYETFQKSAEGQQEQEARVLVEQAKDRLRENPFDENAQRTIEGYAVRFGKDPGAALALSRDWEKRRRAYQYATQLADSGNPMAQEAIRSGRYVEMVEDITKDHMRVLEAQRRYAAIMPTLTIEEREFWGPQTALGHLPSDEVLARIPLRGGWQRMVTENPNAFYLMAKGRPMSADLFAGLVSDPRNAPFVPDLLERQQKAVLHWETLLTTQQKITLEEIARLDTEWNRRRLSLDDAQKRLELKQEDPALQREVKRRRLAVSDADDRIKLERQRYNTTYHPTTAVESDQMEYGRQLQKIVDDKGALADTRLKEIAVLERALSRAERFYGNTSPEWKLWKAQFVQRLPAIQKQIQAEQLRALPTPPSYTRPATGEFVPQGGLFMPRQPEP